MIKANITIVVVTRNRSDTLKKCLQSISDQKTKPNQILVVNNDSTDNTSEVIDSFKAILPIREFIETSVGYPVVYNSGLMNSKTKWVAFIDDDCVADTDWYDNILDMIGKYPDVAVILGNSINYYDKNPYACAFQYGNKLWLSECVKNDGEVVNYGVFDSRNIIYNKKLLNKNKIKFDKRMILGSEDIDLGLQINSKNLIGVYSHLIKVRHKEPTNFQYYKNKKNGYKRSKEWLKKNKNYRKQVTIDVSWKEKLVIFLRTTKNLSILKKLYVVILRKVFN